MYFLVGKKCVSLQMLGFIWMWRAKNLFDKKKEEKFEEPEYKTKRSICRKILC